MLDNESIYLSPGAERVTVFSDGLETKPRKGLTIHPLVHLPDTKRYCKEESEFAQHSIRMLENDRELVDPEVD
jgi:hypothetical protein